MLVAMKEKGTLQSYVAQHRNSPEYPMLLSLATTINRVSDATKAGQVQPQQETVADRELNALAPAPAPAPQGLPEDSGIAQLPAPNMQSMAGGGIVAFEEGGEVPRFQNQGLVYAPYGATAQPTQQEIAEYNRQRQQGFTGNLSDFVGKIRNALPSFTASQLQPTTVKETVVAPATQNELSSYRSQLNSSEKKDVDTATPPSGSKKSDEAGAAQTTGGRSSQQLPGFPSVNAAADALTGIDALLPKKEESIDKIKYMAEREDISKPVWAKAEGMINKEKNRLNEGKEQDFYMALIEGGLAAAGASGANTLQNIAQGFSKGAGSYASALKDFRKASQENAKMELDIERAKAAEKRGDMDAYQKAEDSIKNRNADIDKLKTSGLFQLTNTNLAGQYSNQSARISAAGSVAAAGAATNAKLDLLERLGAAPEGSNLRKGLELQSQEDKIPRLYSEYTKQASDPMKGEDFMRRYPNFQTYLAGMGGAGKQGIIDIPGAAPNAAVRAR
jgi:hypothetical protein